MVAMAVSLSAFSQRNKIVKKYTVDCSKKTTVDTIGTLPLFQNQAWSVEVIDDTAISNDPVIDFRATLDREYTLTDFDNLPEISFIDATKDSIPHTLGSDSKRYLFGNNDAGMGYYLIYRVTCGSSTDEIEFIYGH